MFAFSLLFICLITFFLKFSKEDESEGKVFYDVGFVRGCFFNFLLLRLVVFLFCVCAFMCVVLFCFCLCVDIRWPAAYDTRRCFGGRA